MTAFARGLAVIDAFNGPSGRLSVSEVAAQANVSRAAARRLLHTLEVLGYARQDDRGYSLTPRVLRLGASYLSSARLSTVIRPHLRDLVQSTNEFSAVSILDGDEVVYIANAIADRVLAIAIPVGTRSPAHLTATGRVLLAALDDVRLEAYFEGRSFPASTPRSITDPQKLREELNRVRTQGYAWVDREFHEDIRSLAFPLYASDGTVVAAIHTSSSQNLTREEHLKRLSPALSKCATAISDDLRHLTDITPLVL